MRLFWLTLALLGSVSVNASTLIHNVKGYTLDEGKLIQFSALEFDQARVTHLYTRAEEIAASSATARVDGAGATLLPGLIDAHGHIADYGQSLSLVDLSGASSEAEAVARVRAYAEAHSGTGWLLGRGWNQVLWPGKSFPTKASLDAVFPDRPVALQRVDGHAAWVNSAALALAGIDRDTPDPAGGAIERDAQGEATGVLIDTAEFIVNEVIPPTDADALQASIRQALTSLASMGLTTVHDAGTSSNDVAAMQALLQNKQLPIRVYAMLDPLDEANITQIKRGPILDPEHQLVVRSIKLWADGALGSRGASLYEDYSDQPGHRGLRVLSDEQVRELSSQAMRHGYQVNIHAIGDEANGHVLDILTQLQKYTETRTLRHRIEHAQVMEPDDIPRMAAVGVIASIQPTHATSDKNMAGDRLGQQRLKGAYAWRDMLQAGVATAGGSDFPVESPNPFFGLHAAVTRQDHGNQPAGGWLPDQKLTREQALALFTEGAAWAAHQERETGRLLPGYRADFILVRDDYFQVPERDIWRNKVLQTWVGGEQVYQADP